MVGDVGGVVREVAATSRVVVRMYTSNLMYHYLVVKHKWLDRLLKENLWKRCLPKTFFPEHSGECWQRLSTVATAGTNPKTNARWQWIFNFQNLHLFGPAEVDPGRSWQGQCSSTTSTQNQQMEFNEPRRSIWFGKAAMFVPQIMIYSTHGRRSLTSAGCRRLQRWSSQKPLTQYFLTKPRRLWVSQKQQVEQPHNALGGSMKISNQGISMYQKNWTWSSVTNKT